MRGAAGALGAVAGAALLELAGFASADGAEAEDDDRCGADDQRDAGQPVLKGQCCSPLRLTRAGRCRGHASPRAPCR
ncbi:MAG: hypothetical protein DWI48_03750 [Chloroflexi bacterium]|nr:MAG: hypothetical protein DWI48_03750 [Chloroflexota bacterium]